MTNGKTANMECQKNQRETRIIKEIRASHLGRLRPRSDDTEEIDGLPVVEHDGAGEVWKIPDGARPLQGADCNLQAAEARECNMPRNKALEALRGQEVGRKHTARISKLWEQHTLEMRLRAHSSE